MLANMTFATNIRGRVFSLLQGILESLLVVAVLECSMIYELLWDL